MFRTHNCEVIAGLLLTLSCGGSSSTPPPMHTPVSPTPAAAPPSTAAAPAKNSPTLAESKECPNPGNHCLESNIVFIASRSYTRGHVFVEPAQQTTESNSQGQAQYKSVRNGHVFRSPYVYRTQPANPLQLHVGQLVIVPFNKAQRIFEGPPSRKSAYSTRWWLTRIVSLAELNKGFATLAGGYHVARGSARIVINGDNLVAVVSGPKDSHFLTPQHLMITSAPLLNQEITYANIGVALQSREQPSTKKHYMLTKDGSVLNTAYVVKTRKASIDDLKQNTVIFMPFQQRNGVFVAPENSDQALIERWWSAKVNKINTAEGIVETHNGYRVSIDAIRVTISK